MKIFNIDSFLNCFKKIDDKHYKCVSDAIIIQKNDIVIAEKSQEGGFLVQVIRGEI